MTDRVRPRRRPQVVDVTYLNFDLAIRESSVTVSRGGRRLDVLASVSTARRFCRGYRQAEKQSQPLTVGTSAAGSDKKGQ